MVLILQNKNFYHQNKVYILNHYLIIQTNENIFFYLKGYLGQTKLLLF